MTNLRTVSVLAFDWNGTLVDDAERARGAANRVLRELGLTELTKAEFTRTFTLPMRQFFLSVGVPERRADEAEARWNEEMATQDARLSVGAMEILETAAECGIPVVVVSAAALESVHRDARRLNIDHLLSEVIASVRDKASALAQLVSRELGSVIYVGDVEYDMRAALAAGAYPIGFGRGYRPAAALADAGAEIVVWNLAILSPFLTGMPANW